MEISTNSSLLLFSYSLRISLKISDISEVGAIPDFIKVRRSAELTLTVNFSYIFKAIRPFLALQPDYRYYPAPLCSFCSIF